MIKHFMFNDKVQRQNYDFGFTDGKLEQFFIITPEWGATIVEEQYRTPNVNQSEIDVATFIEAVKAAFLSFVIGGFLSSAYFVIANKILAKRKVKKETKGQH